MNAMHDILSAIKEVTGITIDNFDKSLLHADFGITISDFLYILDILDQKGYDIYKIIENNNYIVFTANNLAQAIS